MKQFIKDMCGKLAVSALQVYKNQKIYEVRCKAADAHAEIVDKSRWSIRIYLFAVVLCAWVAGGLILLPASFVLKNLAGAYNDAPVPRQVDSRGDSRKFVGEATTSDIIAERLADRDIRIGKALEVSHVVIFWCSLLYIVVPAVGVVLLTTKKVARSIAHADKTEAWLRGQ